MDIIGMTGACDLHGQVDDISPLLKIPVRDSVAANHTILRVERLRCCCQCVHRVQQHWTAMHSDGGIPIEGVVGASIVMPLYSLVVLPGGIDCIPHCGAV